MAAASELEARLMRFASDPDPGTLLDPGALSDATALLQAADDLRGDVTAIGAVGFLHFLRWMANQDDFEELQVAVMLSAPLLDGHAEMMPKPVRKFLAKQRDKKPKRAANPAKAALRAFLTAKPSGRDAAWSELLWQLSLVLYGRYQRTSEVAALAEAASVLRHAVKTTRPDDPALPKRQASLSSWLLVLHQEKRQAGDLRDALRAARPALAETPEGGKWRPAVLSVFGSALHGMFDLAGDLDALHAAIKAHRDALRGLPPDAPGFGRHALSLAGVLLRHFERTRNLASLDEAIGHLKQAQAAVERDAEGDPAVRATLSNNLSIALRERYERMHEQADLEEAIAQGNRAVIEATTAPVRRAAHGTLGRALLSQYLWYARAGRYNITGTRFLGEALEHLRAAVPPATTGDPRRAVALWNLGTALLQARGIDQAPGLTAEAAKVFGRAAGSREAAPSIRIQAGTVAGRLAAERGDWPAAGRYLADAVGLLESAVPRALHRHDREHQLRRLRDLACDAAACAWRNGDAGLAAVLFEQGRGVLLAQEMDIPTDLTSLRAHSQDLADQFGELRKAIEGVGGGDPVTEFSDWAETAAVERRIDLIGEWDELITRIRRSGLPGFLLPPRQDDLRAAASEGPVVFINVSSYGSAAFLIQVSGITAVDLPGLSPAAVRAMVAELLTMTGTGRTANEIPPPEQRRRLAGLLEWLWDAIASPVLDRLELTTLVEAGGRGPRVWWCPSGLLSFLPVHAAGHHGRRHGAVPQTVMDRAISSYIPTIRMLQYTRHIPTGPPGPTLIVAPDGSGLPGAAKEAVTVGSVTDAEVLAGADATPSAVLSALAERGRVHFACHAYSDLEDPSRSYLELHDGQPLAVADVAASRLTGAQFAFLAACSTYQPGPALADEAIHLGSAFQMAGFPQVIATLWPVLDTPSSRRITGRVYRGTAGPGGLATTAAALHRATREERDRAPDAPQLWAPYVHSGA